MHQKFFLKIFASNASKFCHLGKMYNSDKVERLLKEISTVNPIVEVDLVLF